MSFKGINTVAIVLLACVGSYMTTTAIGATFNTDINKENYVSDNTSSNAKLDNNSLVRDRRATGHHFTEEIVAQAICQADAAQRNMNGIVYAVGRRCPSPWYLQYDTCASICASPFLHVQDSQTAHDNWSCIQAYHIYYNRPATTTSGQRNTARLGLKSKAESCNQSRCGPNYCCCIAT